MKETTAARTTRKNKNAAPATRTDLRRRLFRTRGVDLLMSERSEGIKDGITVQVLSDVEDTVAGRVVVSCWSLNSMDVIQPTGTMDTGFGFECDRATLRKIGEAFLAVAESVELHHTGKEAV